MYIALRHNQREKGSMKANAHIHPSLAWTGLGNCVPRQQGQRLILLLIIARLTTSAHYNSLSLAPKEICIYDDDSVINSTSSGSKYQSEHLPDYHPSK